MGCVQCRWLAGCCVTNGDQAPSSPGYPLPDTVTSDPSSGRCLGGVLISIDPKHASSLPSSDQLSSWPPSGLGQEIKPFGPQFSILRVMPARVCFSDWWRDISRCLLNTGISSACLPAAYTPLQGDSDNSVCTVWVVRWCQWCREAERRILIMKWGRQFSALHVFSFLICCFAPVLRSIQYSLCISSAQPTTTHHMWLAVYRAECAHIDNCSMH